MPTLDEAISVFWDGVEEQAWPIESFQEWLVTTGEQPIPEMVIGGTPGQFQPLWIKPWLKLFAYWCRCYGRIPAVLVRAQGDFIGELAEVRYPDMASRLVGMTHAAAQQGKEFYEVEVTHPPTGIVATPEGVVFIWLGAYPSPSQGFRWYTNSFEGAARELWPREPYGTFFNMTGGKKIERGFWGAAPTLAQDVEAAVRGLLGYHER